MEISITWNICRVCLQEENKNDASMRNIFVGDKKLVKNIFECSGVLMKENDGLPEKICHKCLKILKYAIYFRTKCQQSDENLQSVIQRTKSASSMFKQDRCKDILDDDCAADDPLLYDEVDDVEGVLTSTVFNNSEVLVEPKLESSDLNQKRKGYRLQLQTQKKIKTLEEESSPKLGTGTLTLKYEHDESNSVDIISNDDEEGVEIEEVIETAADVMHQNAEDANTTQVVSEEPPEHQENIADNSLETKNSKPRLKVYNLQSGCNKLSNASQNLEAHVMQTQEVTEDESELDHLPEEESETINMKANNDTLYYILNSIKSDDHSDEQGGTNDAIDDDHVLDDNVDFAPIEEEDENMAHIDEHDGEVDDGDDTQSQVTSTVVTKEEIDLDEDNSNLSQNTENIDTEYIVDEYILEDNNSHRQHKERFIQPNISTNVKCQKNFQRVPRTETQFRKVTPAIGRKHGVILSSTSTSQHCVCELCGNTFTNRQLLRVHMKRHRQEKTHECELCFKRFITACNLQAHMRIHTGEKPFECEYCGRRFTDRSTHIRHERIHTNEKPFACEHCEKSFSLATTLQAHLKVHTGERPYRCIPCAKSFKLPHQLKAHQNTSLHKTAEQLGQDFV